MFFTKYIMLLNVTGMLTLIDFCVYVYFVVSEGLKV